MSRKQLAIGSEDIDAILIDRLSESRSADGSDGDVHGKTPVPLLKEGLHAAEIDQIEAPMPRRSHKNVDVAPPGRRPATHRAEDGDMANPARHQPGAQGSQNVDGALKVHWPWIAHWICVGRPLNGRTGVLLGRRDVAPGDCLGGAAYISSE